MDEMKHEGQIRIDDEIDIVTVRKAVRQLCTEVGFSQTDVTRVVTAASELARNIFHYAGKGVMKWCVLEENGDTGIELIFEDKGPGIEDIKKAMDMGYTTGGGLGMGLPGAKRLMDKLEIESEPGKGTTVIISKWLQGALHAM